MHDPYQVVRDFEAAVAEYAGSKHGVAVDSCTSALFLSLLRCGVDKRVVTVPCRTYPSVPCAVVHAGGRIAWDPAEWRGTYQLRPFPIVDGAKRFRRSMYEPGTFHCLSFHAKKILPIGRGGMILTDDEEAAKWLKLMRFDGREECSLSKQRSFDLVGWNCYMTPEQAARGLQLFSLLGDWNFDQEEVPPYPDLSVQPAFKEHTA